MAYATKCGRDVLELTAVSASLQADRLWLVRGFELDSDPAEG